MIINKWYWKNYKSYGQVTECIELDKNQGKLYLLLGSNGMGKSALIQSVDLALYGEVSNKSGKRLSKENYPNRINGDLKVGIEFENNDKVYTVERSMQNKNSALKIDFKVDDINYNKPGVQKTIEECIGFDYKTYKSFISMDVNAFKNFISLTPDEKRILLDKLFNIEQINKLNKLLKQLKKDNDIKFSSISNELKIYEQNIYDLQMSIESYKQKQLLLKEQKTIDNTNKITELKEIIKINKDNFETIEQQKNDIEQTINEFEQGINKLSFKKNNIIRDIKDIKDKITLYKGGKCPTCLTDLTGELNLLNEFEENLDKSNLVLNKLTDKISLANKELMNNKLSLKDFNTQYNKIITETAQLKADINILKQQQEKSKEAPNYDTSVFEDNLQKLINDKDKKQQSSIDVQKLNHVYDMLLPIWSENGIKRDIIDSIIDPINMFIEEDLHHLKTRFKVELDNNFDAHIFEYNNEIEPETLSTGEAKKINLIIMLAYIKMLRAQNNINVLFLDEVFSSIDIEGIDDILMLFKKFANERNINIFLVHHSQLKQWMFDKIIEVNKNTFSYLTEKDIN